MTAPPTAWTAGTLASDLCQTLGARGWITVREIALDDRLTHRGDVVAMLVSGRRNRVDVYELKVARSDLLGDLRREKWRAYLEHGAVWFAFPAGLADPREIPLEAGVIIRRADGWRQVRAPRPFAGGPSVSLMRRMVMAVRSQVVAPIEPRDPGLWAASRRARTENARLVLGTVEKAAENPLLPSDQPWENATNNYYPNVTWDAEAKLWKMWYKDVLADKDVIAQMDGPSTVHDVGWYLLYATSKDGLKWEKPALGLHKFAGSSVNNIVARDCPDRKSVV